MAVLSTQDRQEKLPDETPDNDKQAEESSRFQVFVRKAIISIEDEIRAMERETDGASGSGECSHSPEEKESEGFLDCEMSSCDESDCTSESDESDSNSNDSTNRTSESSSEFEDQENPEVRTEVQVELVVQEQSSFGCNRHMTVKLPTDRFLLSTIDRVEREIMSMNEEMNGGGEDENGGGEEKNEGGEQSAGLGPIETISNEIYETGPLESLNDFTEASHSGAELMNTGQGSSMGNEPAGITWGFELMDIAGSEDEPDKEIIEKQDTEKLEKEIEGARRPQKGNKEKDVEKLEKEIEGAKRPQKGKKRKSQKPKNKNLCKKF